MSQPLQISSLQALVFRCPIENPVVTSFGLMRDRPMVLVRAQDTDGAVGWGEIWCNFPTVGAEHRARLLESVVSPLVREREFEQPQDAFAWLSAQTAVLALQSGEPGPLAQVIAGVDIAIWDLLARKAGKPLWQMLGGNSPRVAVYASGLNPECPEKIAATRRAEGYSAFKVKIGFGAERDLANLRALRETLGTNVELMVDANQAWTLEHALKAVPPLERFDLQWLEEPLRADAPWEQWQELHANTAIPLAAGENLAGEERFCRAVSSGALGVLQPDIAKWGGFSGCISVARSIIAAGARFCPHYLGGGIGLLASAHLLAAVGGNGMLEVDANFNPLRTLICGPLNAVQNGAANLGSGYGLGIEPDLDALAAYAIRM